VQWRAAIAAVVAGRGIGAQPAAARLAVWIDALYGPAGQVLHGTSRSKLATLAGGFLELGGIVRREPCGVK